MNKSKIADGKKNFFQVLTEELFKKSFSTIFLAIVSGLILGAILIIITTPEVYLAFKNSFLEGLTSIFSIVISTYSSLFVGAVGDPGTFISAFQSGDTKGNQYCIQPIF